MRDGWTETTLGEVCRLVKGISYKSSELVAEGEGIPFINLKSIDRGGGFRAEGLKWFRGNYKREQLVQAGDLVLCCTDLTKEKAILGYPLLVPKLDLGSQFCISLDMANLIVNRDMSTNEFMYLMLQGSQMREFMTSNSSGTTVMHLQTRNVGSAKLLLPPLIEQKRIADLTSAVDSYIAALQQQADAARSARSAVLSDLLSAGGDDWTETTLGPLITLRTGKLDVNAGVDNGEFPFFTCSRDTYKIDVAAYAGKSVIVAGNGDLNVKYYEGEFNAYQRTYILQTVDETVLNPKFLFCFMEKYVETLRNDTQGSTIQYLKKGQFIDAPIGLPSLVEQSRIVDVVSSMDEIIKSVEQAVVDAKNLRSGLLSDLLSGAHEIPESYDRLLGAA